MLWQAMVQNLSCRLLVRVIMRWQESPELSAYQPQLGVFGGSSAALPVSFVWMGNVYNEGAAGMR